MASTKTKPIEKTKASEKTTAADPKPASKASAIAYNVRTNSAKRHFWLRCGVEFAHEDGKGSTILLNVMPLDGRIAVRAEADADAAAKEAAEVPAETETEPKAKGGQRAPDMIVYSVRNNAGGRSFWTEIGTAYKHKDGKGKSIALHALSLDAKLVLRDRSETVRNEPAVADESVETK